MPGWETRRTTAYARLGNGDPERGRWIQMLASVESFRGIRPNPRARSRAARRRDHHLPPTPQRTRTSTSITGGAIAARRARQRSGARSASPGGSVARAVRTRLLRARWLAVSMLAEGKSALDPAAPRQRCAWRRSVGVALVGSAARRGGGRFARIFGDFGTSPVFLGANGEPQIPAGTDSSLPSSPPPTAPSSSPRRRATAPRRECACTTSG